MTPHRDVQVPQEAGCRQRRRPTSGFALISAIFLMVVLGLLAFFLMSLSGTQQFTGLWAIQGARAQYAAQSGLQWGAWQALHGSGACNGTLSVNAGAGAPAPFTVAVRCSSSNHVELGVSMRVWAITANARSGNFGQPGFVQRTQVLTVSEPLP